MDKEETREINLFAIIGKQQVQIELLNQQLTELVKELKKVDERNEG